LIGLVVSSGLLAILIGWSTVAVQPPIHKPSSIANVGLSIGGMLDRSAWTNDLTLALCLLKPRRLIWTCKQLALGLFLLPSFVVFEILRGAIWILLFALDLLAGDSWPEL
jgi:hypothetical protein